jgi:hypothetical protein
MSLKGFDDWISREPEYVPEFAEGDLVMVRYPLELYVRPEGITDAEAIAAQRKESESWPELLGSISRYCGEREYLVTVEDDRLAENADGYPAGPETPPEHRFYPQCFREGDELRELTAEELAEADSVPGVQVPDYIPTAADEASEEAELARVREIQDQEPGTPYDLGLTQNPSATWPEIYAEAGAEAELGED